MRQETTTPHPLVVSSVSSIADQCLVRYEAGANAGDIIREATLAVQCHINAHLVTHAFTRIADILCAHRAPDVRAIRGIVRQLAGAELHSGSDTVLLRAVVYCAFHHLQSCSADEEELRNALEFTRRMLHETSRVDEADATTKMRNETLANLDKCAQIALNTDPRALAVEVRRYQPQLSAVVDDLRRFKRPQVQSLSGILPIRKRLAQHLEDGDVNIGGSLSKRAKSEQRDGVVTPIVVEYTSAASEHPHAKSNGINHTIHSTAPDNKTVDTESETSDISLSDVHPEVQQSSSPPNATQTVKPMPNAMHQLASIRKHPHAPLKSTGSSEGEDNPKPIFIAHSRNEDPRRSLLRRPKRGSKRPTRKWCYYCSKERALTNGKRRGYIETYCSRCFVNVCEKHWHAEDGHQTRMCQAIPPE